MTDPRVQREPVGSEAGFTLVEVLIAIVVLVFGLIAIANLFLVATTSNTNANVSTAATAQATEVMDRLKAIPFANLSAGGDLTADTGSMSGCEDSPSADQRPTQDCVVPGNYNAARLVPGVGRIKTRWMIEDPGNPEPTCFITVQSEGEGVLFVGRTRAVFTTFRACTSSTCPPTCP